MKFQPVFVLGVAVAATLLLSGCVVAIGDGDEHYDNGNHVDHRDARNREALASMPLGTSLSEVQQKLGDPDFTEAWESDGKEIRVLRYRTHRMHADGDTTRDETTPLLFRDNALVGIGDHAYAKLLNS